MPSLPALIGRIRHEYTCMPGLKLTVDQARRLLSVDADTCGAALDALIAEGFLHRTGTGKFIALPRPSGHAARANEPPTSSVAMRCPHCQKLNTFERDTAVAVNAPRTFRCVACRQVVTTAAISA